MASVRAKRLLPILFLLLSACSRVPASPEQAKKTVAACGLTVESIQGTWGFDYIGTAIYVKKTPQAEFDRKVTCVHWLFVMKRIEADISNGSESPYNYISI